MSSQALVPVSEKSLAQDAEADTTMFVTFFVSGQMFGLDITHAHEIFYPEAIYHVPMAPSQVAGLINLRGRIVTVINMRDRLSIDEQDDASGKRRPYITTDMKGELYSLRTDKIGDILEIDSADVRPVPPTVPPSWRQMASGVCQLQGALLIILDLYAVLADAARASHAT